MGKSIEEECLVDEKLGLWMYGEVESVKISSWASSQVSELRRKTYLNGKKSLQESSRKCVRE